MPLANPTQVQVSVKMGMPRGVLKRSEIQVAPVALNFANDNAFTVDPSNLQLNVDQFPILGIYVNNSSNPLPLICVTSAPISETIVIPAYSCARLPIESGSPMKLLFYSNAGGAFVVGVWLLNYVPAPQVWYPNGISINSASAIATYQKASNPLGYDQVVGLVASQGLPSIPAGATTALCYCETQSIRWRDDGVAPTAAVGMLIVPGQYITFNQASLASVKLIQVAATATLDVSYYD